MSKEVEQQGERIDINSLFLTIRNALDNNPVSKEEHMKIDRAYDLILQMFKTLQDEVLRYSQAEKPKKELSSEKGKKGNGKAVQ